MRHLIWARKAQADLAEIRAYIASDNPEAADRIADQIRLAAELLLDFPRKGRPAKRGFRLIIARYPYLIRYRVRGDEIEIARVYHGARRVRAKRGKWRGFEPAIAATPAPATARAAGSW